MVDYEERTPLCEESAGREHETRRPPAVGRFRIVQGADGVGTEKVKHMCRPCYARTLQDFAGGRGGIEVLHQYQGGETLRGRIVGVPQQRSV